MKSVSKGLFVFAGLLAAPVATKVDHEVRASQQPVSDPRLVRLHQFLAKRDCPITRYAADFIQAADDNDLDWRLLPSISVIESGGGKEFKNNNVFGWNSCKDRFPSVRAGIHFVAARLSRSNLYRAKSLDQKLRTYNPRQEYPAMVKSVMRSIGSHEPMLAAVR